MRGRYGVQRPVRVRAQDVPAQHPVQPAGLGGVAQVGPLVGREDEQAAPAVGGQRQEDAVAGLGRQQALRVLTDGVPQQGGVIGRVVVDEFPSVGTLSSEARSTSARILSRPALVLCPNRSPRERTRSSAVVSSADAADDPVLRVTRTTPPLNRTEAAGRPLDPCRPSAIHWARSPAELPRCVTVFGPDGAGGRVPFRDGPEAGGGSGWWRTWRSTGASSRWGGTGRRSGPRWRPDPARRRGQTSLGPVKPGPSERGRPRSSVRPSGPGLVKSGEE
ncbi:hypothetical protein K353_04461 [Kitasatospora sp. SolWspMP-SS2h]|nr:hypothetical protein K353_04461 [Kitasatospora sp. SolWspMP-SS2h]